MLALKTAVLALESTVLEAILLESILLESILLKSALAHARLLDPTFGAHRLIRANTGRSLSVGGVLDPSLCSCRERRSIVVLLVEKTHCVQAEVSEGLVGLQPRTNRAYLLRESALRTRER